MLKYYLKIEEDGQATRRKVGSHLAVRRRWKKKDSHKSVYIYIYTYFIILKFKVLCFIFKIAIKFDHTQFTRKINLKKIIKIFIRTYLPNFKLV